MPQFALLTYLRTDPTDSQVYTDVREVTRVNFTDPIKVLVNSHSDVVWNDKSWNCHIHGLYPSKSQADCQNTAILEKISSEITGKELDTIPVCIGCYFKELSGNNTQTGTHDRIHSSQYVTRSPQVPGTCKTTNAKSDGRVTALKRKNILNITGAATTNFRFLAVEKILDSMRNEHNDQHRAYKAEIESFKMKFTDMLASIENQKVVIESLVDSISRLSKLLIKRVNPNAHVVRTEVQTIDSSMATVGKLLAESLVIADPSNGIDSSQQRITIQNDLDIREMDQESDRIDLNPRPQNSSGSMDSEDDDVDLSNWWTVGAEPTTSTMMANITPDRVEQQSEVNDFGQFSAVSPIMSANVVVSEKTPSYSQLWKWHEERKRKLTAPCQIRSAAKSLGSYFGKSSNNGSDATADQRIRPNVHKCTTRCLVVSSCVPPPADPNDLYLLGMNEKYPVSRMEYFRKIQGVLAKLRGKQTLCSTLLVMLFDGKEIATSAIGGELRSYQGERIRKAPLCWDRFRVLLVELHRYYPFATIPESAADVPADIRKWVSNQSRSRLHRSSPGTKKSVKRSWVE